MKIMRKSDLKIIQKKSPACGDEKLLHLQIIFE